MIGNTCCMQTAREIFEELDKAIRKNKDELTFGGYSKDIINSIKEKYLHRPQTKTLDEDGESISRSVPCLGSNGDKPADTNDTKMILK